jgi:hypothetical protein
MNSKQIFTPDYSCIDKNARAGAVMNALVAYARSKGAKKNHLTSGGKEMTEKGIAIQALVAAVVTLAADEGVVVTVENRVRAERPITGQFDTIIETRWARKIYQHYGKLNNPELVAKTVDELNLELGKIQKLGGAQAWNGERYAEVGFMIGDVELETEAQLAEYILNVALAYELELFKDVVKKPVHVHSQEDLDALIPGDTYQSPVRPLYHEQPAPLSASVAIGKEIAENIRSHGSPLPLGDGASPVAMGHPPLVVLETIDKLEKRGTPLATKLAEQGRAALAGDFGAYDHPYLPAPVVPHHIAT